MTELSLVHFLFEPEPWKELAACKDEDPDKFVLDQGYTTAEAKKFCEKCSVTEECESYARRTRSVGVWGGKLFTLKSSEPVELLPVQIIEDWRPQRLVPVNPHAARNPGILGHVAGFRTPGILGR